MGIAIGIGIGTTNITGSSAAATPFFEILAESGDFLMSEMSYYMLSILIGQKTRLMLKQKNY